MSGNQEGHPSINDTIHQLYKRKKYRRYFKYLAITSIVLSLILVFLWPYFEKIPLLFFQSQWMKGRLHVGKIDLDKKFIEHAKFIGGGSRPYVLIADRAQQMDDDKVALEKVQAQITLKNGGILSVLSQQGEIQIKNQKHARLWGNVNVLHDKGDTEIWTESLFIDMKKGFLETDDPVGGMSLYGALKGSQGIYIHQDSQFYKLKGPSDLMISPAEKER